MIFLLEVKTSNKNNKPFYCYTEMNNRKKYLRKKLNAGGQFGL